MNKNSDKKPNNKNEYKNLAHFWRLSWIMQIFASFFLICFIWFVYVTSYTFFRVEEPLLPGRYSVNEISDAELIRAAHVFLGYMEVYTHSNAKVQFMEAAKLVSKDYLDNFEKEYLKHELQVIEDNQRSQILYMDTEGAGVDRLDDNTVEISIYGSGHKIANRLKMPIELMLSLTIKVNKDKAFNQYGLEVVDFKEQPYQQVTEE